MLVWVAAALAAQAATPNPDRPSVSRSGYLVAPSTLELEAGLRWSDGSRSAPATLKYAFGEIVEGRLSADLGGIDGAPGLEAGVKVGLLREDVGLALFVASAVPTSSGERWDGTVQGLLTVPIERAFVQVNGGVDLVGERYGDGIAFGGVPVAGLLGVGLGSFTLFGELAAKLGGPCDDVCDGVLDGGLGWLLTDVLIADVGVGWDLDDGAPIVQLGLTANFGRFRAL